MNLSALNDISTGNNESGSEDRLVFPINVHDSLQSSAGLKKGEKIGIIVSVWVFICALLGWFLMSWLRNVMPSYYIWIVIAIEVILQLTVGVYILRFLMDERSMFAEMNSESQSFANYFKIYREIKSAEGTKYPFDIIEFEDGSYGVFLECRLGHNTQARSENTYAANKSIVEILSKSNLPWKTFYCNESFKSSEAAQDLRDILHGVKYPELFSAYRDIVQNYLNIAQDQSNVVCATYLIYAPTRIAKDDLLSTMNQVFTTLTRDETVYRQISAMTYENIVEFLRQYYRLEVLDMGFVRSHIALKKSSYTCSVSVLKIYGKSGKIYAKEDFAKLSKEILTSGGLNSVN